jgi:hypothetical protein
MNMAQIPAAKELTTVIAKLRDQRRAHEEAIAEIDSVFADLGIDAGGGRRRGRPAGRRGPGRPRKAGKTTRAKKTGRRGRRTRGVFAQTAEESILGFVKKAGKPTTAEINTHWTAEGRGGKADNTLTKLVQAKKLKRVKDKNVRGSRYTAA